MWSSKVKLLQKKCLFLVPQKTLDFYLFRWDIASTERVIKIFPFPRRTLEQFQKTPSESDEFSDLYVNPKIFGAWAELISGLETLPIADFRILGLARKPIPGKLIHKREFSKYKIFNEFWVVIFGWVFQKSVWLMTQKTEILKKMKRFSRIINKG